MAYNKPNLNTHDFALFAIQQRSLLQVDYSNIDNSIIARDNFYIPITFFKNGNSSPFATYDESLQSQEYGKHTLTFSIAKYVSQSINPSWSLMTEGRRLRLQTFEKCIDFIITAIQPTISSHNVIYKVTCQDIFSYDLSKNNIKINFQTLTPLNIRTAATQVLELSLLSQWQVDPTLEAGIYADFPSEQLTKRSTHNSSMKMLSSFDLTDTTPYNALTEICKKFNANMEVEYSDSIAEKHTIYFINKGKTRFTGCRLRTSANMTAFSVSRNINQFNSVLLVTGGEDADGNLVSLSSIIPPSIQQFLDMFYPITLKKIDDEWEVGFNKLTNVAYPFASTIREDGSEFTLYKKTNDTWGLWQPDFKTAENRQAWSKPWTACSAEDIERQFNFFARGNFITAITQNNQTDEYFVFLTDRCPAGTALLYNFDYFVNQGIMDQQTKKELDTLFSQDLRNINLMLAIATTQYYSLTAELESLRDREEEYAAELAALSKQEYPYILDPTKNPTVREVSENGETLTLTSSTLLNNIANERSAIQQALESQIWTDRYFDLIMTLYGQNGLVDYRNKMLATIADYKTKWSQYFHQARDILNNNTTATTVEGQEQELSKNNNHLYIEYATARRQANFYAQYIDLTSDELQDTPHEQGRATTKRGIYSILCDNWGALMSQPTGKYITNYNTHFYSVNLLDKMASYQNQQRTLWQYIYANYSDFIVQGSFEDADQLSSNGLYTSALNTFIGSIEPQYSYSATILDTELIMQEPARSLQLFDIVYLQNMELASEYSGQIKITTAIPDQSAAIDVTTWNVQFSPRTVGTDIYQDVAPSNQLGIFTTIEMDFQRIHRNHNGVDFYFTVAPEDLSVLLSYQFAPLQLVGTKTGEATSRVTADILSIEPLMREKPIPLQVTGLTRKLREYTTQLTISTDRTLDTIYQRLLKQARF